MSKLIINNNKDILIYPIKSNSIANINNTLDEWIRFLSYVKPEELVFLNELDNKKTFKITAKEMEKYLKIKKQLEMSELFLKYKNKNCSKEEYDKVIRYMNNSLKDFMKERLTEAELEQSYKILSEFHKMSKLELNEYIDRQMSNYDNLTILEAYLLYEVKEIKHYKVNNELNDEIRNNQIERGIKLRRSLIKEYGLIK